MASRSGAYLLTITWSLSTSLGMSTAGGSGLAAEASRRLTTRRSSTRHVATRLLRALEEEAMSCFVSGDGEMIDGGNLAVSNERDLS
uniref:Secreted protein n=1 Tax=Triticum urartu TaxID=4572 RepID=A0A8R7PLJ7_TRIUA